MIYIPMLPWWPLSIGMQPGPQVGKLPNRNYRYTEVERSYVLELVQHVEENRT